MVIVAALGLIVLVALVLTGWRAKDDDDDESGPGGRRLPIRIPTHDRGPPR